MRCLTLQRRSAQMVLSKQVMLLLLGMAQRRRGAVGLQIGQMASSVWKRAPLLGSQRAMPRHQESAEETRKHAKLCERGDLLPVRFVVDEELRSRLRLIGKHRRARVFVAADASEDAVRNAICEAAPPLRHVDYALETVEGSLESPPMRVRVVAKGGMSMTGHETDAAAKPRRAAPHAYQMLSWYAFFENKLEPELEEASTGWDVQRTVAALAAAWGNLSLLGRAYVAPEGINAQLAVPVDSMDQFAKHHESFFKQLRLEGVGVVQKVPLLNLDAIVPLADFEAVKPFRALHVRPRAQVVADGDVELDPSDNGREADPAEWHELMGGDFDKAGIRKVNIVLDCRNHYESAIGTFDGAVPLETETFKETYERIDAALADKPRDAQVAMFCTGGIRCEKAGAYVKQKLGFNNVTRLAGGIVNYTQYLKRTSETDQDVARRSRFRGVNFVFNDRLGEPVVVDDVPVLRKKDSGPLDARAAEALALAKQRGADGSSSVPDPSGSDDRSMAVETYAERLSGEEPPLIARVRFDVAARWPRASHMVCGPTQGRLLAMLCRMIGAKTVLELGCFVGYSALWLATALPPDGRVVTIERDPRAIELAKAHFADAPGSWAPIDLIQADTAEFLSDLLMDQPVFDLVYLDADKKGYAAAVDALLCAGKLRPGGLVVADNTLWKGRVLDGQAVAGPESAERTHELELKAKDAARQEAKKAGANEADAEKAAIHAAKSYRRDRVVQQSMHEFNMKVRKDPRFEQIVLPLRDGITIAMFRDTAASANN